MSVGRVAPEGRVVTDYEQRTKIDTFRYYINGMTALRRERVSSRPSKTGNNSRTENRGDNYFFRVLWKQNVSIFAFGTKKEEKKILRSI